MALQQTSKMIRSTISEDNHFLYLEKLSCTKVHKEKERGGRYRKKDTS